MTSFSRCIQVRHDSCLRIARSAFWGWVAALLAAALISVTGSAGASSEHVPSLAGVEDEIESLFNWAEQLYPEYFPTHEVTQTLAPYRYRYYARTGNYVGVADGMVVVLGPVSGGQVQSVGALEEFRCQVRPSICIQSDIERIHFGAGPVLGLDSHGRLVAPDGPATAAYIATAPLPGSPLRLIASGVRQAEGSGMGGMYVDTQGKVRAWGPPQFGWMGGPYNPLLDTELVTTPREMPWPGPVRQAKFGNGFGTVALLEDGALWEMPPATLDPFGGVAPVEPRPFNGVPRLRSLSNGSGGLHGVTSDGTVVAIDLTTKTTALVAGAEQVRSVACSRGQCLAVRADGTVLAWGAGPLGDGSERSSATAVPVPSLSGIVQVATSIRPGAYEGGAIALDAQGRVWAWGLYRKGRRAAARTVPAHATVLGSVIDVVCKSGSGCMLRRADGTVWHWDVLSRSGDFAPPVQYPELRFW